MQTVREMYQGPAWHGPSLRFTLRGIPATVAAWRVGKGRNTIWELVLHMAYARHRALLRLGHTSDRVFPRPLRASWWPVMPDDLWEEAWTGDLGLLHDYQSRLLDVIATVPASKLRSTRPGQRRPIAHELLGAAIHDAYHTGQIQLIKRLHASGTRS
ncbi:MAG: DinB family protein [Anaerolineae bacterium]|nr:DinB family protein [Gemmatimonadaceae bacterium]